MTLVITSERTGKICYYKDMKKQLLKDGMRLKGSYVIRTYKAGTKELIKEYPPIENMIMLGTGYGGNLILRALVDDETYPASQLPISSASIGSGTTAPAVTDTDLETPVVTGILVASSEILSVSSIVISFFIPDSSLADGTYSEFGIFSNGRLFARSLLSPYFIKLSNTDTTVDYTISYV